MIDNNFVNSSSEEKWFKMKKYSTLLGGVIYMTFPGALYIGGVISPYISTYYNEPTSKTSNILLTSILANCFFMPFGSYLVQKNVNPKLLLLIGAALCLSM